MFYVTSPCWIDFHFTFIVRWQWHWSDDQKSGATVYWLMWTHIC